jgi:two-component system CheB/CheR fusion protein
VPPRLPVGEVTVRPAPRNSPFTRQARLAELCRRLVLQHHAPAAVLLDAKGRCLHALGPIDRYLSHPVGAATQEVLALARPTLRGRLRAALAKHAAMGGEGVLLDAVQAPVLELRTVRAENEAMLLLCFLEPAAPAPTADRGPARERPRILALEQELESTRAELRGAIQDLELAAEDQRAANEEALSVNEEFQSTNEELLTSKEELQSLNEELTALNGQLQETLENSRTTSTDLQNVLFSTEVATLFLDAQLCIRFFTPATRAIFAVLASDIGRPLADLRSLASDAGLLEDAAAVLQGGAPRVQEIVTATGTWFTRRVLPYRAQNGSVEGVVMTFADITLRRESADALHAARALAEQASAAKSRFLSAASHDLRQPLQTLTLLQGLLARSVQSGSSAEVAELVALLEPTLAAMSGMLNTLLDINQIDAGTLLPVPVDFALGPLLERLAQEFGYLARAQGLELRVVPTSLAIRSDPQMLEQILRNLISNALKYTRKGRVLLGCRRRGAMLSIKVWDTGIGIATHEQQAIFDEYHQVGNAARERDQGLGLGLSIVQRFAGVLGHKLAVRSVPGRGSVFTIEVPRVALSAVPAALAPDAAPARTGTILVVEDDPDLRELLVRLLTAEGHSATAVVDGDAALALLARGGLRPDLLLTDHNLPGGYDGPRLAGVLRARIAPELPVVILTADVTTQALRAIASLECVLLHKPVKPDDLAAVLQRLLPATAPRAVAPAAVPPPGRAVVHIVDDDAALRVLLRRVLEKDGRFVIDHASAEDFLVSYRPGGETCLLLDGNLPGQSGYALLAGLRAGGDAVPAIILTGFSDVQSAVAAMRAGASDFIEKPVRPQTLVRCIAQAMERARDLGKRNAWHDDAAERLARLTPRQRAVMDRVLAGEPSKNIAADLGISQRTVETHRAAIMERTGAASLPALARLALAAAPPATST